MKTFEDLIESHRELFRKRGFAISTEDIPPVGQAAAWCREVVKHVPETGRDVAKQLARLCGDDSFVTVPQRSLADAVGKRNRAGYLRAYTERGIKTLVESTWLTVEVIGIGRASKTTYFLEPGDPRWGYPIWLEGPNGDLEEWLDWAS